MRTRRPISLLCHWTVCTVALIGQQSTARLEFETASVKHLSRDRLPRVAPARTDPTRLSYRAISLRPLIMRAYRLNDYQIVGPSWLRDEFYEIPATIPAGTRDDQVPLMIQSLLADRFSFRFHWESRVRPV